MKSFPPTRRVAKLCLRKLQSREEIKECYHHGDAEENTPPANKQP